MQHIPSDHKNAQLAFQIEALIQQDPGKRGLTNWAKQGELLPAAESLLLGQEVVIVTGFNILAAEMIETDGPPGAIMLADRLEKLGKQVRVVVDLPAVDVLKTGLDRIASRAELVAVDPGIDVTLAKVSTAKTTHLIALERPGRAVDGRYYNFKGQDISEHTGWLDEAFLQARKKGVVTIGIGDGGNELGMGAVSKAVDTFVSPGKPFSCVTSADFCLCAGVSNWAGYGLAAMLSILSGRNCLRPLTDLENLIYALVEAGAVDGVTGRNEMSVDGLGMDWERMVYKDLLGWVEQV